MCPSGTASWAVVATVDEPAPLVAAFAAHHLNEGAASVHLFLDSPDPETEALLRGLPGCHVTLCDASHWQGPGGGRRPRRHPMRQIVNANLAYQACRADWLVHCDADEFIRDGRAMAQELAQAPQDCLHMRLKVAERALRADQPQQGIFDGIFRLPRRVEPWMMEPIYRDLTPFFTKGLTGHTSGKAVVRTGQGLQLSIHEPEGRIPALPLRTTRLLHFDGPTALSLCIKLLRRAAEPPRPGKSRHPPGRQAQIARTSALLHDPEALTAFVTALRGVTPDQIEMLAMFDLIDTTPFHPNLGALALDLAPPRFDAILRQRQAAFLDEIGIRV